MVGTAVPAPAVVGLNLDNKC